MTAILLTLAVAALLQQTPPAPATPAAAEDWRTAGRGVFSGITFDDDAARTPAAVDVPPAVNEITPEQAARDACRGAVHRRINEAREACEARLIASGDALRPPGVPVEEQDCRRETSTSPDGGTATVFLVCGDPALDQAARRFGESLRPQQP